MIIRNLLLFVSCVVMISILGWAFARAIDIEFDIPTQISASK